MRLRELAFGLAVGCVHGGTVGETAPTRESQTPPIYEQASKERPPHPTNKLAHVIVDALTALPTPVACHEVRAQIERVLAGLGAKRQYAAKCPGCEEKYLLPDLETSATLDLSPGVPGNRPSLFRVSVEKSGTQPDPAGVLNVHFIKLCRHNPEATGGDGI